MGNLIREIILRAKSNVTLSDIHSVGEGQATPVPNTEFVDYQAQLILKDGRKATAKARYDMVTQGLTNPTCTVNP